MFSLLLGLKLICYEDKERFHAECVELKKKERKEKRVLDQGKLMSNQI